MAKIRKKLIEVALPLEAINAAAAYEKMPGIGPHPRGIHLWWARRPLAAARAVIFAQMVDDPSEWPDLFPSEKKQDRERRRVFQIIEDLVLWENSTNQKVLQTARDEIWASWRRTCVDNMDHPEAKELFDRTVLPAFYDPFAGGGALPLEAQRLGLKSYGGDLNPVAVLINKAMIEIPPKFAGRSPVNPEWQRKSTQEKALADWDGARGLAEDIRYYGQWMHAEAKKRIGHLYPPIEVTPEMAKDRPDLVPYVGQQLNVIAWIWVRTVKSPNPAFLKVDVPLASTFMLSTKVGNEAYVEPIIDGHNYRFTVKTGKPKKLETTKNGTKLARGANFKCLLSEEPIDGDYIKAEGRAGRMSTRLMAIVAEGTRGRIYLPPTPEHESVACSANPSWRPETPLANDPRALWTPAYGLTTYGDLFTSRQLVALSTLSDLVEEARERIEKDAVEAGYTGDSVAFTKNGNGAAAYAEAIAIYLAFIVDRCADFSNSCTRWVPGNQKVMNLFGKQAIAMTWDFPEAGILHETVGGVQPAARFIADCLEKVPSTGYGFATQQDATTSELSTNKVVSTDPPYYDNIGYADLSDFFYVWLRRSLRTVSIDLFSTMAVPKTEELVASPYRHGSKQKAEKFFLSGMTDAMHQLAKRAHPAFPVTIYYAFKQSESSGEEGTTNTGWDTFLAAIIEAGFSLTGTWPMRSEQEYRIIGMGTNALASSIVLVCRPRPSNAPIATRRDFLNALKSELPAALAHLQAGNIAPVDLAQAAIGPGMAVYTRYAKVLDAEGKMLSVRSALALINQNLDEALAEQEGDFDAETRWALAWFEQLGFEEGEFGIAEQLSKAKNISVDGLVESGIIKSGRGKVQLLRPSDLTDNWDPQTDLRLTTWETVHRLIQAQVSSGEAAAALIVVKLGGKAETARELCYRLYTLCERKRRASDAMPYNALVQSWPEIVRLAKQSTDASRDQPRDLFSQE